MIEEAMKKAASEGKLKPQNLDKYLYEFKDVIGADLGKCTKKIQLYVTPQGDIHARPVL